MALVVLAVLSSILTKVLDYKNGVEFVGFFDGSWNLGFNVGQKGSTGKKILLSSIRVWFLVLVWVQLCLVSSIQ